MHAFDVLGDPVRRRILELLGDGELPSGAVCAVIQREFGISQPAVSQHLKVLQDARLVVGRKEGRNVYYSADPQGLRPLAEWMQNHLRFWEESFDRLGDYLRELKNGD